MTNLPNLLTLMRIFLVPLLVAALVQQNFRIQWGEKLLLANDFFALTVFLAAALTDLLDGYLARRWKQVTTVGTLLDPVADKLLISAALISLVEIRLLPGWMVILIISREFAVSGLRSIAAAEGYTIKAGELGKSKMMFQVVGVGLVMLSIRWWRSRRCPVRCWWCREGWMARRWLRIMASDSIGPATRSILRRRSWLTFLIFSIFINMRSRE